MTHLELVLRPVACECPEVGTWLGALEESRQRTIDAIAGISAEELDWAPPGLRINTISTLLYHIAAIELDWSYGELLEQAFPGDAGEWFSQDVRDAQGVLSRVSGESLQRHLQRFAYVREKLAAALRTMSAMEFERVRRLQPYNVTPRWIMHHLLQHEAEHRGQIRIVRKWFRDRPRSAT